MTFSKNIFCTALFLSAVSVCANVANAEVYELENGSGDLVGAISTVHSKYDDTFIEIGRPHNLGFEELRNANPQVDPWLPGENTEIVLPTEFILPQVDRQGIVINVAEYRIYYFFSVDGNDFVSTVPASIGRMDWSTPVGLTGIVAKVHKPSWYPPESVRKEYAEEGRELPRVVPPGPENPLGDYALRLGLPGYLIHGTNRPAGVGMRVTHGCIRLFPEDIEWIFPRVSKRTPVRIINEPLKFGWRGDDLFLEAHPQLEQNDEDSNEGPELTLITREYVKATREQAADVDWELIARTYKAQTGMPVKVGSRVSTVAEEELVSQAE
jgi:L,D-transpeptidase ErfK/SrfK